MPFQDEGIDLIAETFSGDFWSIQSKYRSNKDIAITSTEVSSFVNLSFLTANNITFGLIVHTSSKPIKKKYKLGNTAEIGLDFWLSISEQMWKRITHFCKNNVVLPPKKRIPKKHQKKAIQRALNHFVEDKNQNGKLIMPCGTGKSLTAFWIARELNAKTVILAVPSLALIRQSLLDWTSEYLSMGIKPDWLVICSDDTIGDLKNSDNLISDVYESGIETTTDKEKISNFLKSKKLKIIFTTYQSSQALIDGWINTNVKIDLLIADEAHKTVGLKNQLFSRLLSNDNIKINKRVFMTATERIYRGIDKDVLSMDNNNVYGKTFYKLSFKEAIENQIISDYRIVTVSVSQKEVEEFINQNKSVHTFLDLNTNDMDVRSIVSGITLIKVFKKYNLKKAISFHKSIKRSEDFTKQQDLLTNNITNSHISGKMNSGKRSLIIDEFSKCNKSLISNSRCLTEGIDIPEVDCILFADPKKSIIDIVQSCGRAMRKAPNTHKKYGYIIIPVIIDKKDTLTAIDQNNLFNETIKVVTALSTTDERIIEEFNTQNKPEKDKIIQFYNFDTLNDKVDISKAQLKSFKNNINTILWRSVGKANWKSFEDAKKYSISLKLKSTTEWREFSKSNEKPFDIPSQPDQVYKNAGWLNWGDFLGTGRIADQLKKDFYPSYEEAKSYIHKQKLNSNKEWREYVKSDLIPDFIPKTPEKIYVNDWKSWSDWLGTNNLSSNSRIYLDFDKSHKYALSLKLPNRSAWYKEAKNFPKNIPYNPFRVYKNKGWISWAHWLNATPKTEYLNYENSKKIIQNFKIKSRSEFNVFKHTGKKPDNIPKSPDIVYRNKGWKGWGQWLGTGYIHHSKKNYLSYEEAKNFVHKLKLRSRLEWQNFYRNNDLPSNIPKSPHKTYKNKGYISMGDWLGSGYVHHTKINFLSYNEAKELIKTFNLQFKNVKHEWRLFCKNKKPDNIPSNPENYYGGKGWISWKDFLNKQ